LESEARDEEASKLKRQEQNKRIELGRQKRSQENALKRNKLLEDANIKKRYLQDSIARERNTRRGTHDIEERNRQKELRKIRSEKMAKYEKIKVKTSGDMLLSFWGFAGM
jgi:hypothetical protein